MSGTPPSAAAVADGPLSEGDTPVVRTHDLTKWYGPVKALTDVNFEIHRGEIVSLVGDNGAGKSTFAKLLAGVITPTHGSFELLGEEVQFHDPSEARERGIETVYQDLALVPHLDVGGNLFLGREPTIGGPIGRLFGLLDLRGMARSAEESLEQLNVRLPSVRSSVGNMSGGQRQATAIARTVLWGSELIIMDEPVAALGVQETEKALVLIEDVGRRGVPLIVISHNMEHVFRVSTRVIVFRQGRLVADLPIKETSPEQVVGYITGAIKPNPPTDVPRV